MTESLLEDRQAAHKAISKPVKLDQETCQNRPQSEQLWIERSGSVECTPR
jgi:hypothetical protein